MALHRRRKKEMMQDLELTTFLNLLVVLISFLLVTSVFSRIAIQELKLPTAAAGGAELDKPLMVLEVILRKNGIEISDGKGVVASMPMIGDKHDLKRLSEYLLNLKAQLKAQNKEKTDATLLIEPEVAYEDVIHVMDAVKAARVRQTEQEQVQKIELFPDVSVGDAP
jgi:biopolymer transport protein ExbD